MYSYHANLVRVINGDSLILDIDLGLRTWRRETIRLFGLNCPEKRTAEGLEAWRFAQSWFETHGPEVTICTHQDRQEKYGRWLGTIVAWPRNDRKPVCLNDDLIANGHAVAMGD